MTKKGKILSVIVILLLAALDRASKVLASQYLKGGETVSFVKGILSFQYHENTGAAFGSFQGGAYILAVFTALLIIGLTYYLFFGKTSGNTERCALVLIIAGGLGNLYDRVVYGFVVDFLKFEFISFPLFNVADSCVTVGAVLLLVAVLFMSGGMRKVESEDIENG